MGKQTNPIIDSNIEARVHSLVKVPSTQSNLRLLDNNYFYRFLVNYSKMTNGKVNLTNSSCTYKWELDQFCIICRDEKEKLISPFFRTVHKNQIMKWHLYLYLREDEDGSGQYLSLYLRNNNDIRIEVEVKFTISNTLNSQVVTYSLNREFESGKSWGYQKLITHSFMVNKKNSTLSHAKLIIVCNINKSSNDEKDDEVGSEITNNHMLESRGIACDIKKLFDKCKLTDVTLRTSDGQQLVAHKCVLAARSSVFDRMFNNDMKESHQNLVSIEDIPHGILKELLRYVYSEEVEQIDDIAKDLLKAANKYDIKGLLNKCEDALLKVLSLDNVLDYVKLADDHNATKLKAKSIDLIALNFKKIVNMPNFKSLTNLQSTLISEILSVLALKMD